MAESLREVIARIKQQNSPQETPKPQQKPIEVAPVEEDEDLDAELEDEAEEEIAEAKPYEERIEEQVTPKNSENKENKANNEEMIKAQMIMQQVEALQNNGVFRMEVLGQLDDIKHALNTIAGCLVELTGKK